MSDEQITGRHFSGASSAADGARPVGRRFASDAASSATPAIEPLLEDGAELESEDAAKEPTGARTVADASDEEGAMRMEARVEGEDRGEVPSPDVASESETSASKSRRRLALRALLGIVLVLVIAVAAGAVFINQSIARGRKAFEDSMNQAIEEKGKTVEYNGKTYALNKNMVSVAFIGFDNRTTNSSNGSDVAGQSDTIMVIALNTDTGKATGIVIPRDSMVDVDTYISGNYNGTHTMQICLQYSYGATSEESSELVARCASRVLYGMPIDHYFTLNVEGVGPLNDAVGGVTLVPVQSVPSVGIVEGVETTLYGKTAERYVQFRDTSTLTSSLDRQRRQVSYLKAFTGKVLRNASSDPAALLNLYQTAQDYTWTNLGFDQFSYLASTMLSHGMTSFDVVTLDGEMGEGETYAEFHLNQDSVYQTVLDTYYTPVDDE